MSLDKSVAASQEMKAAAATHAAAAGVAANNTETASTVASATTQTAANEESMASKVYNWYAGMGPWGIAAAAATIAALVVAISQVGKITGREKGGIIGLNGPEYFLGGERGPEVIAPPSDFVDWANANQNLGYNLAAHDAQMGRIYAKSGDYATAAHAQAGSNSGALHVHLEGATVIGESGESARIIGNKTQSSLAAWGRRAG